MPTTRRYELSDAQWARLEPLLPPEKPWTGRPNDDHRRILNGILWILNSVARPAAALWSGGHGVEPVLPLAPVWRMAARVGGVAGPGRCPGAGRLGVALPGQHGRARSPACRRGQAVNPRTRRWAARVGASQPRSTCAARATASLLSSR